MEMLWDIIRVIFCVMSGLIIIGALVASIFFSVCDIDIEDCLNFKDKK